MKFLQHSFEELSNVIQLKENNIVNCLGFASKTIFKDQDVYAVKGHILEFDNPSGFSLMCQNLVFKDRLVEFFGHDNRLLVGKSQEEEDDYAINQKTLSTIYETAVEFKRYYETPSSKL